MSRFLDGLTDAQRGVVEVTDGHLLVLAGPGSGKTHTVTAKIGHLFATEAVPSPFRVVALTFTNAAAREMRHRLRRRGFSEWDRLFCGTYHAFGQHLLAHFGRFVNIDEDFEVDPSATDSVLEEVAGTYGRFTARDLRNRVDQMKRIGVGPDELPEPTDDEEAEFAGAYADYARSLRKRGLLDYGDLILWSSRLLARAPAIRDRIRNAYRYVIADEFQDTDSQQLAMVVALASAQASTVVADDDQSIYAWRGAVRANVFAVRDSLGATQTLLGTNFRSDEVIVEAALSVIAADPGHQAKELVAASTDRGAICGTVHETQSDEAKCVASRILTIRDHGLVGSDADIAIIARTHRRVEDALTALHAVGVPFFNRDKLKFEDSWDAQLALASLYLAAEPDSHHAVRLVFTSVENAGVDRLLERDAVRIAMGLRERLAAHGSDAWGDAGTLRDLLAATSVLDWISRCSSTAADERQRLVNIGRLLEAVVAEVGSGSEPRVCARRFLGEDAVQVMTGHGSKGREFDVVFLLGLEDGTLPSYHAVKDPEQLPEERRIFYVGLTRAKRLAMLTRVRWRENRGGWWKQAPSRFLASMPDGCFTEWPGCLAALPAWDEADYAQERRGR